MRQKSTLKQRKPIQEVVLTHWISACRRIKLDSYLLLCTKVDSKGIKDLNLKHKILELLEENTGDTPQDVGTTKNFSKKNANSTGTDPMDQQVGYTKIKSHCTSKKTISTIGR